METLYLGCEIVQLSCGNPDTYMLVNILIWEHIVGPVMYIYGPVVYYSKNLKKWIFDNLHHLQVNLVYFHHEYPIIVASVEPR